MQQKRNGGNPRRFFSHCELFQIRLASNLDTDSVRNADNQRIAHAKSSATIAHTRIRPALRKTLQLIELIGNKTAESTIHLNNVLETRSPNAAFAS